MSERLDIAQLMPTVAKALFGDPTSKERRGTDWRYGRRGSLSIDVVNGRWFDHEAGEGGGVLDLIRRERRCDTAGALRWIEGIGEYVPPVRPVHTDPKHASSLRDAAMRIWQETREPRGTLVERYLINRRMGHGIECPDLRYHPRCPFGKGEAGEQSYLPAMVALVRNPGDRNPMGIHRTALTPDGRKIDRKMLGPCHGGVVMLSSHEADTDIGVCEGIETGLAVIKLFRKPVWAALSAGSIAALQALGGVRNLKIYADNDAAGIEAAQKCARVWIRSGIEVSIEAPTEEGWDFADALEALERGELSA